MDCDCGCHDTPGTLRCEVCQDAHVAPVVASAPETVGRPPRVTHLPESPEKKEDEFGDIYVFSEERLAKLKGQANEQFTTLCQIIKNAEGALAGFTEWARSAEANEKRFYTASKAYVETLKTIYDEGIKTKF